MLPEPPQAPPCKIRGEKRVVDDNEGKTLAVPQPFVASRPGEKAEETSTPTQTRRLGTKGSTPEPPRRAEADPGACAGLGTGSARSVAAREGDEGAPGLAKTERIWHPPPGPWKVSPGPWTEPPRRPRGRRPVGGIGKPRLPPKEGGVPAPVTRVGVRGTRGSRPVVGYPHAGVGGKVGKRDRRPQRGR